MDLNETRKKLELCLGEDLKKEYFAILRECFMLKSPITTDEFNKEVRKLLINEEQIRCHNYFMLAFLSKTASNKVKMTRISTEKGVFECADYYDYIQPSSPIMLPPSEYENRSAAAELFMPDSSFISMRIAITAWENGLDGAEGNVTELIVHACQVFVKNILTAMISRIKSYKVRDKKFQYGFNLPVPDPLIRNFDNVIDESQECKVEVLNDDDCFVPKHKTSLENAEQQAAFAYSCARKRKSNNMLTVKLLYDTLRDNPHLLGSHEMQSVSLLKLSLLLED